MNKKAMGVGQVFVFIIAALTFAVIMIFGYKAIGDFLQQGEKVQFYQFKTELETDVQRIYSEYGSVRVKEFHTPGSYEQICFVDLDAPFQEELCQFDQFACDVWKDAKSYGEADANVFLKPPAPVSIKVKAISMVNDFLCFPITDGIFLVTMEGKGDKAHLSSDLSEEGIIEEAVPLTDMNDPAEIIETEDMAQDITEETIPHIETLVPEIPIKEVTTCAPERLNLGYGRLEWGLANNDITVVAPHGGYDFNTENVVLEMTKQYPVNYVLAIGFRNKDGINVNRPTEAVSDEIRSERAALVYEVFRDCVDQYPQRMYLEIHGYNEDSDTKGIQIATVNVDAQKARFIKNYLKQNLPSELAGTDVVIQPIDRIHYTAGWNKRIGMLSHCDNVCIHIELPRSFRKDENIEDTAFMLAQLMKELDVLIPD
ncbi:MAG: hypothetical protein Q7K45_01220 [Nanoarchaeota archaeon]|nr:hypothetical protein [Nanoarchaeota archaeon]